MLLRMCAIGASLFVFAVPGRAKDDVARTQGSCPSSHVFLKGDEVSIALPSPGSGQPAGWKVTDYEGQEIASGKVEKQESPYSISLGRLPVGYYRIELLDAQSQVLSWTSAAVLMPLAQDIPEDSPIGLDVAVSWFAKDDPKAQEIYSQLAKLAGVSWVRDRMTWGEIEKEKGVLVEGTSYDSAASIQKDAGLRVLQVWHSTPPWCIDPALDGSDAWKRFPRDLRNLYDFSKAMAIRYKGRIQAWEPWNEANIDVFGGHTIDEMCSLQKAAYWGFKDGNPDLTVCWNVFAGSGSELHTQGVMENEASPYFDTYNIHSYSGVESYLAEFETARKACAGKPLWITECGTHLERVTDLPWGDISPKDERRQSEFLWKSYASSLFAGTSRHFFFILGNYVEGKVQFGLLRLNKTPRPGYVALAAAGRLLAQAQCLGRIAQDDGLRVYAFRARPDGEDKDVLVAWASQDMDWTAPVKLSTAYDHLGRELKLRKHGPVKFGLAPTVLILEPGQVDLLDLEAGPASALPGMEEASRILLQAEFPASATHLVTQSHVIEAGQRIPIHIYNFSQAQVTGQIRVEKSPDFWTIQLDRSEIRVDAMSRTEAMLTVTPALKGKSALSGDWVKLVGDFGPSGRSCLAFRLIIPPGMLQPSEEKKILSSLQPESWIDNISPGSIMTHSVSEDGGILFEMQFKEGDCWGFPMLVLKQDEGVPGEFDGLALTLQVLEGEGPIRVQFVEENGSHYITDISVKSGIRETQSALALFDQATWGPWSLPDEDGKLTPDRIRSILVGINPPMNSSVKMLIRDLSWVKF